MRSILIWLTLLSAGATVLLLAAYLVPTAIALYRANRNLAQLVAKLEAVRDNTASLAQDLPAVNSSVAAMERHIRAVDAHLQGITQSARR